MTSTLPFPSGSVIEFSDPVLDLSHPRSARDLCRRFDPNANAANLRFRINQILSDYGLKIEGKGADEFIGNFINFLTTYSSIRYIKDAAGLPIDETSRHTVVRKVLTTKHFMLMRNSPVYERCRIYQIVFPEFLAEFAEFV